MNPSKEERKRLLIEMMKEDEKNGMYEVPSKTDNELIAEFMGVPNVFLNPRFGAYQADDEQGSIDWVEGIRTLDYHRDWNLLMPVVEKIQYFAHVEIANGQCLISVNGEMVSGVVNGSNIENVYMAVVRYIKWYNSQQHESK